MAAITTPEQADQLADYLAEHRTDALRYVLETPHMGSREREPVQFLPFFDASFALKITETAREITLDQRRYTAIDWARCGQRQRPSRGWRRHVREVKRLQRIKIIRG